MVLWLAGLVRISIYVFLDVMVYYLTIIKSLLLPIHRKIYYEVNNHISVNSNKPHQPLYQLRMHATVHFSQPNLYRINLVGIIYYSVHHGAMHCITIH